MQPMTFDVYMAAVGETTVPGLLFKLLKHVTAPPLQDRDKHLCTSKLWLDLKYRVSPPR